MEETQVNIMIPTELWKQVNRLVAMKTIQGERITKKIIIAEALERYIEREAK